MKNNLNEGETLIAEVSGNFYQFLSMEQISFYNEEENTRIPVDYNLEKSDGNFYIYALLGNKLPGNYSLRLENVKYKKYGSVEIGNFQKNFLIINKSVEFSFSPNFIVDGDYISIGITNLENRKLNLNFEIGNASSKNLYFIKDGKNYSSLNYSFLSQESKFLNFEIGGVNNSGDEFFSLSSLNQSYTFPVFLEKSQKPIKNIITNNSSNITSIKNFSLEIVPGKIEASIKVGLKIIKKIILYNSGERNISNLSITLPSSFKGTVNISKDFFRALDSKNSKSFTLSFFSKKPFRIVDNLTFKTENKTYYLPINISYDSLVLNSNLTENNLTENNLTENLTNKTNVNMETCLEENGTVCAQGFSCDGTSNHAIDSKCCIGTCLKLKKNNTGELIGWGIVSLIVLFLIWFKLRYRRTRNKGGLLKFLRNKR